MGKVLIVATSGSALGSENKPTGAWLEEIAAPYYVFADAGHGEIRAPGPGPRPSGTGSAAEP